MALKRRTIFLANRYEGIQQFVESNYQMIRKAAGRDALRAFLLVSGCCLQKIGLSNHMTGSDGTVLLEPCRGCSTFKNL
jgi:hypothetical protein